MLLSCILMKDYLWGTSPHADGKTLSNQTNSMRLTTSHYTDNNPVKDENKISSHLPHRYKMFLISTVHTNFASKLRHENLELNYQICIY